MEHPGFTMGKVRQVSADLDGFRCTNDDSYSGIDPFKNSSNAIPIGRCVKSCSNFRQSEISLGKARQKQQEPGTAGLAIVTAGLIIPAYWNDIR